MVRKAAPQPLALPGPNDIQGHGDPPVSETTSPQSQVVSPAESRSPRSPRTSPFHGRFSPLRPQTAKQSQSQPQQQPQQQQYQQPHQQQQQQPLQQPEDGAQQYANRPNREDPSTNYPSISSAFEPAPTSNPTRAPSSHKPNEGKKSKTGFFHFNKTSKQNTHYQPHNMYQHIEPRSQTISRGSDATNASRYGADGSHIDPSSSQPISSTPSGTDLSVSSFAEPEGVSPQSSIKKPKSKPFGLLGRSRSIRDKDREDKNPREKSTSPVPAMPVAPVAPRNEPELQLNSAPLRTAPVAQDRSFRDMMNSSSRNRSADRIPSNEGSNKNNQRDRIPRNQSSSLRENGGIFLNNLRNTSTRAADLISKGFFGKSVRSGSTTEKESAIDDENYQLKIINLPLIEQTRITRISKRLEDSRDKTEFWMPAFPWRAIDYLNYKGCEVEGLYRVPGSGPQIKKWQRRFDEKYDVNLFDAEDLYDINIVGSMLKAWLRELPDELFPKAAQERIARECAGSEQVPELLIEELSNLSPYQYYLLFAITCHLSLLLAHSEKNKMDFRNLCICFQPCMKIDAFCFKFLVCDWRDCWRGCKNESQYIEEEYLLFDQPPPRGLAEPQKPVQQDLDTERQQLSSSDSSALPEPPPTENKGKLKKKRLQLADTNGSTRPNNPPVSNNGDHDAARQDLRPLSPIKPLSPLGF